MNRRKFHISQWWLLGFVTLLTVGCLMIAVGDALARYRVEQRETLRFSMEEPEQICLGQLRLAEDGQTLLFDDRSQGTWERVNGQVQLDFAVANSVVPSDVPQEDRQVRIRLAGSLGVWDGGQPAQIQLLVPKKTDPTQYDVYPATATKIQANAPMHDQFGDGWVFTFRDEQGEERIWNLAGGQFSCYEMRLVLEDGLLTDAALLQLQVMG